MDDTISPPVVALLRNQSQDNLLEDLSPIGGSSPGKHDGNSNFVALLGDLLERV